MANFLGTDSYGNGGGVNLTPEDLAIVQQYQMQQQQEQQQNLQRRQQPQQVPFTSWEDYQRVRAGDDPNAVYNDYGEMVLPAYLKSQGYTDQQIAQMQAEAGYKSRGKQPESQGTDRGIPGNVMDAVTQAFGNIGSQAKIATALETGNTNMLLEAVREQQQRKPGLPEQRFSKALGDEQGVGFLKNLPGAITAEPQGAFDALLGTVVGFAPFIAGGAIGGLAGPLGAAGGMAAVGGQLALGQRAAQAVVQAAQKANVDINDETAFYNWAKNGGLEGIFGPAIKGALTEAAVMAITGKVAGMFTGRAEGLLAKMAPSEAATPEALASLRAGVRNAQLGELATNVGGFTAASVAGDIAAGDTPSAREAIVSALTLLPTSLLHLKGKTGEAKRLEAATEETQKGLKQPVQLTDEEKQKILEMPTKEMTDEEMESQLREEAKPQYPADEALAAVNTARDVIKEVQNEKAIEQAKTELAERSGVPSAESKAAEQPVESESTIAAPEATGVPTTTGEAASGERAGGPATDAAVLEGAVSRDTAQPTGESRPVLDQEGADKGVAAESQRGEQAGIAGTGGEPVAPGPVISGSDATGEGRVGGVGEIEGPKSVNPAHEVMNWYTDELKKLDQKIKDAQAIGDTKTAVKKQEQYSDLVRKAKDWLAVTADLEGEKFDAAIDRISKLGLIKNKNLPLYQAIADGNTRAALSQIAGQGSDLRRRVLAKTLLRLNILPRAMFWSHENPTHWGTYYQALDTIALDSGFFLQRVHNYGIKDLESTFLHEVAHAGTVNALSKAYRIYKSIAEGKTLIAEENKYYLNSNEYKAAEKIFKTFEWLKENQKPRSKLDTYEKSKEIFTRHGIAIDVSGISNEFVDNTKYSLRKWKTDVAIDPQTLTGEAKAAWESLHKPQGLFDSFYHYGATDPLEMVAEIYTNPKFQDYLKTVTLPKELTGSKPANAWQWLVNVFKQILGFKGLEGNALEEIMADTSHVMRERQGGAEGETVSYNRKLPTSQEEEGLRQFYQDYPQVKPEVKKKQGLKEATDQLREELKKGGLLSTASRAPEVERKLPHDAIVGKDEDNLKRSIAYRRDNGTYTYYKVDENHPMGDPLTIEDNLTHAQVTQKIQAEGHKPEYTIGPNVPPKNTTRSGLHGWKDGKRQFAAIAMKDENGKPTKEWRVTTGPDLADTSKDANGHYNSPRTTVQVDSFRDVTRMYGEGGYSPTQKVDEAKRRDAAQAAKDRPESTYEPPGKTAQAINRASGVNYLGKQQAFQAEQRGEPLPLSHRPDLMETRKNALIENQFHKLVRERIEPLKVTGRRIAKNFRKSGKQIESDLVDLAYVSRTTRKLASPLYDATPEAKKEVEEKRKAAQDRLDQLHDKYREALEAYGRELKKFSNDMYDYRVKAQLIPKELAEEIKNSSEFYVPIRQDTRSTVGKRAKGLANVSIDPIHRMVNDWHRTIKENFENQVKQATYRLAKDENIKLPDGSKLFDLAPVVKYDFDPITGMLRETVDPLVNKGDAVVVMFDGKPYRMSVNEEHLLAGLKSVPASEKPELLQKTMRGFSMFNAVYGGLKTAASPVFALKNLRDIQTAFAMADPRVDRGQLAKDLASPELWKDGIAEAGAAFFGKDVMTEAKEQGGTISRRGRFGLEAEQENPHIRLTPNIFQRANEVRSNLLSFEHGRVSNLMTFFTKLSENIPRMAVYSAAMKSPKMWQSVGRANGTTGKAVEIALRKAANKEQLSMVERELIDHLQAEAASASKNATVNFEPKGYASGPLNALFVFANAKTQSARTLAENLGLTKVRGGNTIMERLKRGNPYTQSAAGAYFLGGLLFAMYGYKNDPDNYSRLSDYAKDEYATYKSGGLSVPLSQDLAIAWTFAQALVDAKMNPRWADPAMRQTKAATRFVTQFIQNFWPGGTSMSDPVGGQQGTTTQYLGRLITPTTMQIAHDLSSNQNPFGSPIVTGLEQAQRKNLPIYEVNKEKVSPLARGATQVLHKAGVMDAAPQSAQYLIDQFVKQNVDFVHSVAPTWEFFNGIFGAPKKGPEGEDRPNSFERTFFQQASPMSYKTDLKELLDRESAIAHDAGLKSTPRLNTLKQGEKQVAEIFKGYEKLTPEQQGQRVLRATEAQKNTLKRYNESFQQP